MNAPYPIVRCADLTVRDKLVSDLKALGFKRSSMVGSLPTSNCLYIALMAHDPNHNISGYSQQDIDNGYGKAFTMVNSPTHMIAYIRRHGIRPFGQ